jgi:hypothetical protein
LPSKTIKLPKQTCINEVVNYINHKWGIWIRKRTESEIKFRTGRVTGSIFFEGNGETDIHINFNRRSFLLWFFFILLTFTLIFYLGSLENPQVLSTEFSLILGIILGTCFGISFPSIWNYIIDKTEEPFANKIFEIFSDISENFENI